MSYKYFRALNKTAYYTKANENPRKHNDTIHSTASSLLIFVLLFAFVLKSCSQGIRLEQLPHSGVNLVLCSIYSLLQGVSCCALPCSGSQVVVFVSPF